MPSHQCAQFIGTVVGTIAAVLAIFSVIVAASSTLWPKEWEKGKKIAGRVIVGLWVLGPPIWFWVDWYYLTAGMGKERLEYISHLHDVGRNIWLALVVVLAALFGIKWPSGRD
jgi:hypothetical protein